jgi:hypothetical protein
VTVHTYVLRVAKDTVARLKDHIRQPGSAGFQRENATVILLPGDFKQTVDHVKSLTGCHVFSIASRPVAGDFAACVKVA